MLTVVLPVVDYAIFLSASASGSSIGLAQLLAFTVACAAGYLSTTWSSFAYIESRRPSRYGVTAIVAFVVAALLRVAISSSLIRFAGWIPPHAILPAIFASHLVWRLSTRRGIQE